MTVRSKTSSLKVAFQGELGAFSQQAILQLLGPSAEPLPRQRFDQVFEALAKRQSDAAVIPIENTLHGSIHENYDLLLKHNFVITAETRVRIIHNLIACPGVALKDVRKVYSHPVAINQCLDFLARHDAMEREPFYDTAGSVKMLLAGKLEASAAIASDLAAKTYGGKILKRGIEDDRQNFTRFFLLEHAGAKPRPPKGGARKPWKTSIVFSTRNVPGALFRALSAVALRDVDLTKIESRPLRGKPWEYLFYLDLMGEASDQPIRNALNHLRELSDFLRVLGSYRAAA